MSACISESEMAGTPVSAVEPSLSSPFIARCMAPAAGSIPIVGWMAMAKPRDSSLLAGRIGVFPPSTMLASSGLSMAAPIRAISSSLSGASMKMTSAPASE